MNHSISISGWAFKLRPVKATDATFIVELRNADEKRNQFLHPVSPDPKVQEKWLDDYFLRPDDYYFVIEHPGSGAAEGTVGIYDVCSETRSAEWGRWVLSIGSLAAVESAYLIYRVGFEIMDLDALYCRTVLLNPSVISFHNRCGLKNGGILKDCFQWEGKSFDAVKHVLTRERWPIVEKRLEKMARRIALKVSNE